MTDAGGEFHAHIYYSADERSVAAKLQDQFRSVKDVLFVGRLMDRPVGPHPIPQFEIHFREAMVPIIVEILKASGLRALVHPLTSDDLADHTIHGYWIGEPLELDVSVLDPPGANQGVARFGKSDF